MPYAAKHAGMMAQNLTACCYLTFSRAVHTHTHTRFSAAKCGLNTFVA